MDNDNVLRIDDAGNIWCNFCKLALPRDAFYESRLKKKHYICKCCFKTSKSNSWLRDKRRIENGEERHCRDCGIALDRFRLSVRCKQCAYNDVTQRRVQRAERDKSGIPRRCSKCKEIKKGIGRDGFGSGIAWCRACQSRANKMAKYRLTGKQLDKILNVSACQICGGEFGKRGKNIDHCHSTGKVRGILCTQCNQGLGMFKDNQRLLLNAMVYLEKSRSRNTKSGDPSNGAAY